MVQQKQTKMRRSSVPRVLIVTDRPAWAFDTIAKEIVRRSDREIAFEIFYLRSNEAGLKEAAEKADLVFFMHWSLVAEVARLPFFRESLLARLRGMSFKSRFPWLDLSRALVGVHSHHDFDFGRSLPDREILPPRGLVDFLNQFRAVNVVSKKLEREFLRSGVQGLACTPNGVDTDLFAPSRMPGTNERLRVGSSGTKKRDKKEGISRFIEPLQTVRDWDFDLAIPQEGRFVPHEKMPEFLNKLDVYVCASATEGFPLKVLEAASCGRVIVSTKVGGCEDLIEEGKTGFFVPRELDAIVDRVRLIDQDRELARKLSIATRDNVVQNWSWSRRIGPWLDFIESGLGISPG